MAKIYGLCVGLLVLAALTKPLLAAEGAQQPNFLFIYTDDQRWDAMGVVQKEEGAKARFPWLKTPNLDRLAAEGTRFRNAFVVNSLCSPGRASFLTGCYGHINGVVNNHSPFPEDNVTYATLLRQAGYATGFVGKWHMGRQRGQRPGFDFSASFIGQGVYFDGEFEVNGTPTPSKGWVDDISTEYASKFMRDNRAKPFVLAVGFKSPHGPPTPPVRWETAYAGEEARDVPNSESTAIYQQPAPAGQVPHKRNSNLEYFRCISAVDENVGKLLGVLDELGIADNTMVVYTTDNGFYMGEHGLDDKRSAYDDSLRLPLIVRYPKLGLKGKLIDQMVTNVDFAPTFVDYAGVAVPRQMQGRSWRPLFEGRTDDWRKAFFYCYFHEGGFSVPTIQAVRTDTAKLIHYYGHDDWTEVFDLAADPYEMKNLANNPAATALRTSLEAEFVKQAKAIDFRIPSFADKEGSKKDREPAVVGDAEMLNAWVLDYRFDKDEGNAVVDASGKANHGKSRGTTLIAGPNGANVRHFNGRSFITVANSPSLNPTGIPWTINVVFKAEKEDGMILSRGGPSHGYCLYLDKGRPTFTVVTRRQVHTIAAKASVVGQWADVTACISAEGHLVLQVGGNEVARSEVSATIKTEPRHDMQIGADRAAKVLEGKDVPDFTGDMERVRLYSGEAP